VDPKLEKTGAAFIERITKLHQKHGHKKKQKWDFSTEDKTKSKSKKTAKKADDSDDGMFDDLDEGL